MSRRGIVTRSTRQAGAGASACASPARSTITRVARSRVSSSWRHVGMLRTASAPSTRNSSRPGAARALERVVGDGRLPALDLDRGRFDAFDFLDGGGDQGEPISGRRDDLAALLPRVTGDDHEHPVQPEGGTRVGRRHDVADVHRVERATEDTDSLDPGSLRATAPNDGAKTMRSPFWNAGDTDAS